jgi:hypothetical protein
VCFSEQRGFYAFYKTEIRKNGPWNFGRNHIIRIDCIDFKSILMNTATQYNNGKSDYPESDILKIF